MVTIEEPILNRTNLENVVEFMDEKETFYPLYTESIIWCRLRVTQERTAGRVSAAVSPPQSVGWKPTGAIYVHRGNIIQ